MSDDLHVQPSQLRERWPILAGIAIAPVMLIVGLLDELAKGVVVAAVIYVVWGAFRRQPGHARWYAVQFAGLAAFGAINIVALAVDEPWLRYLLAFGWVGHATWDAVHHHANRIVPRWYADACIGLDLALAALLVTWAGSVS